MPNRAPYIQGAPPALTPGMSETPEEKEKMRQQLADARARYKGVTSKLLPQPTPIRSEARPKTEEDKIKEFYPMLEEERNGESNL